MSKSASARCGAPTTGPTWTLNNLVIALNETASTYSAEHQRWQTSGKIEMACVMDEDTVRECWMIIKNMQGTRRETKWNDENQARNKSTFF
jgi:hypothetical protein